MTIFFFLRNSFSWNVVRGRVFRLNVPTAIKRSENSSVITSFAKHLFLIVSGHIVLRARKTDHIYRASANNNFRSFLSIKILMLKKTQYFRRKKSLPYNSCIKNIWNDEHVMPVFKDFSRNVKKIFVSVEDI